MPSQKVLEGKKQVVAELSEKLKNSVAGVLVDYSGTTVADDTALRKSLREAGVSYTVIKNTLIGRAADEAGLGDLKAVLNGTTALAVSANDYVAAARILCDFADKHDNFTVKMGFIDDRVISADEVAELSKLPSREELVARALGGLNAPIAGFAGVLNAELRSLVIALNAIVEKQSA